MTHNIDIYCFLLNDSSMSQNICLRIFRRVTRTKRKASALKLFAYKVSVEKERVVIILRRPAAAAAYLAPQAFPKSAGLLTPHTKQDRTSTSQATIVQRTQW